MRLKTVEMRNQVMKEAKPVDLNCGRYCAEAAILWWKKSLSLNLPEDIFHNLLPDTEPKALGLKFGWSPGQEGAKFAKALNKPADMAGWERFISVYGPIIVSGKLGAADWGILGGVGHFILVTGAESNKLYYKDPLVGDTEKEYGFNEANDRINALVYRTDYEVLKRIHDDRSAKQDS